MRWMRDTRLSIKVALIAAACASVAACGNHPGTADCGDPERIPVGAIPQPARFAVVSTSEVEPDACGQEWGRVAVLSTRQAEPLAAFADALLADGHRELECNTKRERCFEVGYYFVAATEPDHELPPYFPQPVGEAPQVLLSIGDAVQP